MTASTKPKYCFARVRPATNLRREISEIAQTFRLFIGVDSMEKRTSVELVENDSRLAAGGESAEFIQDANDPMNWGTLQKHIILACISLLGGLGTYAGLFIVPA